MKQAREVLVSFRSALRSPWHAPDDLFGEKLYSRVGWRLVLMDVGKVVCRSADDSLRLGENDPTCRRVMGPNAPFGW